MRAIIIGCALLFGCSNAGGLYMVERDGDTETDVKPPCASCSNDSQPGDSCGPQSKGSCVFVASPEKDAGGSVVCLNGPDSWECE